MGLSDEEKATLKALTDKAKEPEGPRGNVNFTLDLGSDSAWERAKKLGIVPADPPPPEEKPEDGPKRKGFFGDQQ